MKNDYGPELMKEFVCEAREHLATIEEDFLEMERLKDSPPPELVDKVFRAIHSIKGSAGFLGLGKINDLSHAMETVLQMIRKNEIAPLPETVDSLLEGVDLLKQMTKDIANSENTDISAAVKHIEAIYKDSVPAKEMKKLEKKIKLKDMDGNDIDFEVRDFALKNRPPFHEFLYLLRYELSELGQKGGISPLALVKELLSTGEIIETSISTPAESLDADLSKEPLFYDVLYSTVLDADLISQASMLPDDKIKAVCPPGKETKKNQKAKAEKVNEEAIKIEQIDSDSDSDMVEIVNHEPQEKISASSQSSPTQQTTAASSESQETVRIHLDILDKLMTLAGELVLVRNQHLMAFAENNDPVRRGISQRLDIVTTELQETIMRTRMQPVGNIFGRLPRIVRDLSKKLGKQIEINISGEEVELDKTIIESLADPLTHIIRNSCDHGIETPTARAKAGKKESGTISVRAYHEGGQINIEIHDDGQGIDFRKIKAKAIEKEFRTKDDFANMSEKDIINLITLPGFSTASKVSDISGRGVGMDVVKTSIEQLGGTLEINSQCGKSTTLLLKMPLTLAIIPCLIVVTDSWRYAIPQVNLEELVCLYDEDVRNKIECSGVQEVYRLREKLLPMVRLSEIIKEDSPFTEKTKRAIVSKNREKNASEMKGQNLTFAVVKNGTNRFGLIIDKVLGTEEIVVKPMHSSLKNLKIYSGATVMGDGKCALILDVDGIASHAGLNCSELSKSKELEHEGQDSFNGEKQRVLLFKYGEKEQFAVPLPLIRRIEKIKMSDVELIGKKEYVTVDKISIQLVRMDKVFEVSGCVENNETFLLLPKHVGKPFGLLMSSLTDIIEVPLAIDTESYLEDGILGSLIIKGKMTLFPDIFRVIERFAPESFQEDSEEECQPGAGKKILLAEDAPFFRQLVKGYLESAGYEVVTAENGKAALDILSKSNPDMLISDIEMPKMDGWELIKILRDEPDFKEFPAIALTALDSADDRKKAFELGFNDYQIKIDREALLTRVSHFFNEKAKV